MKLYLNTGKDETLCLFSHPFSLGFTPGDRVKIKGDPKVNRYSRGNFLPFMSPSSGQGTVVYNPKCPPPLLCVVPDAKGNLPIPSEDAWFGYSLDLIERA
jgi:hypothetical protein